MREDDLQRPLDMDRLAKAVVDIAASRAAAEPRESTGKSSAC